METLSFLGLVQLGAQLGLPGLILILWFLNERSREKMLQAYREDTDTALERYGEDMRETRRMYENNVKLVESYEDLAKDLKDVVILNTQAMTRLNDDIRNNQYCPRVRLEKRAKGKQT